MNLNLFKPMTQADFNRMAMIYIGGACLAFWLTHVIYCFATESFIMLVVGAIAFPLGILHGVWITVAGFCNMILWVLSLIGGMF